MDRPCSLCGAPAVELVRYSGNHLCADHFRSFLERKVSREVRVQLRLPREAVVAVAVSGGKDSVVAFRLLHDMLSKRRGTKVVAVSVDEGIRGYRPPAVRTAAENCRQVGAEHSVVTFKQTFGLTMDGSAGKWGESTPCTYCGVLRRYCLNKRSRELGADVLATGLNLDDTVQSVLMNLCRGDVDRLVRMGPHSSVQAGLVPRIQPLRQVTDKEAFLYATLRGFPVHHSVCPYSSDAMRNRFRDMVNELERASPGTRFCVLNSSDAIRSRLARDFPPAKLGPCRECGEPSVKELCEACVLVGRLKAQGGRRARAERAPGR